MFSGVDIKPEVPPGGTWIGLSTETKKISSLLNILLKTDPDPNMRGRGEWVFINSHNSIIDGNPEISLGRQWYKISVRTWALCFAIAYKSQRWNAPE